MIWFYTRDQQTLTLETHYDPNTLEYVTVVVNANAHPETHRFKTLNEFARVAAPLRTQLERRAVAAGQSSPGARGRLA